MKKEYEFVIGISFELIGKLPEIITTEEDDEVVEVTYSGQEYVDDEMIERIKKFAKKYNFELSRWYVISRDNHTFDLGLVFFK